MLNRVDALCAIKPGKSAPVDGAPPMIAAYIEEVPDESKAEEQCVALQLQRAFMQLRQLIVRRCKYLQFDSPAYAAYMARDVTCSA